MALLEEISGHPQRGDNGTVADLTRRAIDSGLGVAEIGADGYGCDASSAVELVKRLTGAA